ncbi:MAG: caspase family protein [Thermoplasmatales archaeon]|nr:MAG: caspase family protein [Thermoplasmatales archaeon]
MRKNIVYVGSISIIIISLLISSSTAVKITENNNETKPYFQLNETPEYYAVIACCFRYKNSSYDILDVAYTNEKILYDVLISSNNWKEENIILLLNENATKENITAALVEMSEQVGPNDIFLFSWRGHGGRIPDLDGDEKIYDSRDNYDEIICPYDMKIVNYTFKNVFTDDELNNYFSDINSKGMCLIFDSCYSGGLVTKKLTGIKKILYGPKHNTNKSGINSHDVDGENRVVIMATPPEKAQYSNRFGSDISIISSISSILYYHFFLNDSGVYYYLFNLINDEGSFISFEEIFKAAKVLYAIDNLVFWIKNPILAYYTYLTLFNNTKLALLYTTGGMILVYLLIKLVGLENKATIRDDFPGELPLIIF